MRFLPVLLLAGALSLSMLVSNGRSQSPAAPDSKKDATKAGKKAEKKGLSLKPERKVEFTADEGTWISLDLSPDGKTILFELLGDLYTMPVEGGEAKAVVTGMAFDSMPRYSPDGKRIAFISDRDGADNLWIANADGSNPKQLSKEKQATVFSPAWTPDGEYVVVSLSGPASRGATELWMFSGVGGSGLKITKGAAVPVGPVAGPGGPGGGGAGVINGFGAWPTKDGQYFYFAGRAGGAGGGGGGRMQNTQIYRRNRLTGDEDSITFAQGNAFKPAVSPNGKTLIFATRFDTQTGLRVRNLANGDERWLKYPIQRDEQEARASRDLLPGYAFTADGSAILISYGGKIHRIEVATGADRVIPFTAKVSLDIGPNLNNYPQKIETGPVRARLTQSVRESPNGKRVAFSSLTELYTADIPASGNASAPTRKVSVGEHAREYQPSWSPDGQWIAYVTWSTAGGHIWKRRADGSGTPTQVTRTAAFYRDPVWSPDGTRIVALRTARQTRVNHPSDFTSPQPGLDIVWIPSAGGEAVMIAPSRGSGRPHFGPEPDRLYVYGPGGLASMRFDGTDRKVALTVTGPSRTPQPAPARDVQISPDGKYALALVTNHLYVMVIPHTGETPAINVRASSVPVKKLTTIPTDTFGWSGDGKTMTWTTGSTYFRQPITTVDWTPDPTGPAGGRGPRGDTEPAAAEGEKLEAAAKPPVKFPGQEIELPVERARYTPKGTVVLRGGTAITMKGDEVLKDTDIVITDNRIAAIGARGKVAIPGGAKIIDIKGKTVMPGMVDIHAHWEVHHQVLDTEDYTYLANIAYGVTSGRDPQTNTNDQFAYQDLVELGEMIGPRAWSTGPGVFSDSDFQSLDEAKNTIARYKKHFRTNFIKSYMVGNRQQRQWMVEACKEHQMIVTTEGGADFKLDLTHAIDGFSGNEHSLPVVPLFNDIVQLFAKTGTVYTPTLLVSYGGPMGENYWYKNEEMYKDKKLRRFIPQEVLYSKLARLQHYRDDEFIFPKIAAGATAILRAGGKIGLGGHGEMQGLQCHLEMWSMAMGGMKPHEILRMATLDSAAALGYASEIGSLEAGKMADLIVLNKDPLADIRNSNTIQYVMKNGEMWDGDTMDQVWPVQKKLAEMWWWKDRP